MGLRSWFKSVGRAMHVMGAYAVAQEPDRDPHGPLDDVIISGEALDLLDSTMRKLRRKILNAACLKAQAEHRNVLKKDVMEMLEKTLSNIEYAIPNSSDPEAADRFWEELWAASATHGQTGHKAKAPTDRHSG